MKQDKTKWKATALLFSGRQNPDWMLTDIQQKSWLKLWQLASLSDTEVESVSKLGYTGCRLQYDEHSHWQLYNGCVSFYEKGKSVSKKDDEKKMELFLLNTAPGEVRGILKQQKII